MRNYYQANKERFLNELFDLLRIPSCSRKPVRKEPRYSTPPDIQ